MDILITLTTKDAANIAAPLARALTRKGVDWACFLTNDGVMAAAESALVEAFSGAGRVVVCEHSWDQHMGNRENPFERGSQTINSAMTAEADRVLSL